MLALFRSLPLLWRILSIVGVLAAILGTLGGVYLYIDHQGYQRATQEWTIKYERREAELKQQTADELSRQQAANDAAKAEEEAQKEAERKRQMAAVDLAMTLNAEAAADPNRDNIALDAAAVDRHNRRLD